MNWEIEAHGEAREVYSVAAETEEEARAKFLAGDAELLISEVSGTVVDSSIVSVKKESEL